MAWYKQPNAVKAFQTQAFDTMFKPGEKALHAGIYECPVCGREIGIAEGHTLPSQDHHQHPAGTPIRWHLLVLADHRLGSEQSRPPQSL